MQYPLQATFRVFALSTQIAMEDAAGQPIFFVKQKLLKLKEHIEVFRDSSMQQVLFHIRADRVIDFSANYSITAADGTPWGAVRRKGARSLWQAHYEVMENGQIDMVLQEEHPWKRIVEAVLGEIPLVGLIAIYLINPTYIATRPDGSVLLRITKKPSILERRFLIDKLADIPPDDELRVLLGMMLVSILERKRG